MLSLSERLADILEHSASFVALSNKTVRATETAAATLRRLHTQRERVLACSRRCDDARALLSCSSEVAAARASGDSDAAVRLLNRAIAIARDGVCGSGGGASVEELQRELASVVHDVEAEALAAAVSPSALDGDQLERLLRTLCTSRPSLSVFL